MKSLLVFSLVLLLATLMACKGEEESPADPSPQVSAAEAPSQAATEPSTASKAEESTPTSPKEAPTEEPTGTKDEEVSLAVRCGPDDPEACFRMAEENPSPSSQIGSLEWACEKRGVPEACLMAAIVEAPLAAKGEPGFEKENVQANLERGCKQVSEEKCKSAHKYVAQLYDLAGGRAGATTKPVTKRMARVDWVFSGELAERLQLKKVKCEKPFRDWRMCHLTLVAKDAFGKREMVWATIYDGDGAQTGRHMVKTPEKPGAIKQRLRLDVDSKRVEFDF